MYIDFMGTDAAIFRTLGKQTAMRTDQYNSRWLNGELHLRDLSGKHGRTCRDFSRSMPGGEFEPVTSPGQGWAGFLSGVLVGKKKLSQGSRR